MLVQTRICWKSTFIACKSAPKNLSVEVFGDENFGVPVLMGSKRRWFQVSMGSDRFRGSENGSRFRWVLTGSRFQRLRTPGLESCRGFEGFGGSGFRRKVAAVSKVLEFRGLMGSDGFEGFGFPWGSDGSGTKSCRKHVGPSSCHLGVGTFIFFSRLGRGLGWHNAAGNAVRRVNAFV